MRKTKKVTRFVVFSIIVAVIALSAIFIGFDSFGANAYSVENVQETSLFEECAEYTESLLLQGEVTSVTQITDYESYVDERFNTLNKKNMVTGLTDEWLEKIIPIQLFEQQKQEFLYIGKKYGFYFDYNSTSNTFAKTAFSIATMSQIHQNP